MSDFPGENFYPNAFAFAGTQSQVGQKLNNLTPFVFRGFQSQIGQSLIGAVINSGGGAMVKHYFLTARCSIGPTQLYWTDTQVSTANAPSCGGTITGLNVLGIF